MHMYDMDIYMLVPFSLFLLLVPILDSVSDLERFDADPDPTFYVDADPNPNFT